LRRLGGRDGIVVDDDNEGLIFPAVLEHQHDVAGIGFLRKGAKLQLAILLEEASRRRYDNGSRMKCLRIHSFASPPMSSPGHASRA
jgi:hypothetical protein